MAPGPSPPGAMGGACGRWSRGWGCGGGGAAEGAGARAPRAGPARRRLRRLGFAAGFPGLGCARRWCELRLVCRTRRFFPPGPPTAGAWLPVAAFRWVPHQPSRRCAGSACLDLRSPLFGASGLPPADYRASGFSLERAPKSPVPSLDGTCWGCTDLIWQG